MNHAALRFHRDKQGIARAVSSSDDTSSSLLAQFFESELGADAAYRERLISEAEKHGHGHAAAWKTSGNSYAVEIASSKVTLRPLFGTDQHHSCTIDLPEFMRLLYDWKVLVG